ncbi:hypothetical protein FRC04_002165 [Tulasnella sp. 424]|nr:hypothetical protein FRC04_002165 [Tulasnella sp. 424]
MSEAQGSPMVKVEDTAAQDGDLAKQGTDGGFESSQPTPTGDGPSLAPSDSEAESLVQPGRQVLNRELPPELGGSLKKRELLGRGQFAEVYVGVWEKPDGSSDVVAIKCIKDVGTYDKSKLDWRIKREAFIWKSANHPNILRFIGYKVVDGLPRLVSPWCKYGSLRQHIAKKEGLTDAEKIELARRGLVHLHSLTPVIVHGDIKLDNVVVQDNLQAALCDFGMSRIFLGLDKVSGLTTTGNKTGGTAGYQAKELLEGSAPTTPGDVYAFGGLILATMSGQDPFWRKKNDAAKITAICMGETLKPADHLGLPEADSLWGLLNECWSVDPGARPTIETVVQELQSELEARAASAIPPL